MIKKVLKNILIIGQKKKNIEDFEFDLFKDIYDFIKKN